jgi:hypothetical protein
LRCVDNRIALGRVHIEKEIRTTEYISQPVADSGCFKAKKRTEKTEVLKLEYETLDEFPLSLKISGKVAGQREGTVYYKRKRI